MNTYRLRIKMNRVLIFNVKKEHVFTQGRTASLIPNIVGTLEKRNKNGYVMLSIYIKAIIILCNYFVGNLL